MPPYQWMSKLYKKHNPNDSFGYDEITIKMWYQQVLVVFAAILSFAFFFLAFVAVLTTTTETTQSISTSGTSLITSNIIHIFQTKLSLNAKNLYITFITIYILRLNLPSLKLYNKYIDIFILVYMNV